MVDYSAMDFEGMIDQLIDIFIELIKAPFIIMNSLPPSVRIAGVVFLFLFSILLIYFAWKNREKWREVYTT